MIRRSCVVRVLRKIREWYQRARYGVADVDLYEFDEYLASILIRSLPKFKNNGGKFPYVSFYPMDNWSKTDEAEKQWDMMIDDIVMKLMAVYCDDDANDHMMDDADVLVYDALEKLARNFRAFWV